MNKSLHYTRKYLKLLSNKIKTLLQFSTKAIMLKLQSSKQLQQLFSVKLTNLVRISNNGLVRVQ